MIEIRLSEAAKEDLIDIWISTQARWDDAQADSNLDDFDRASRLLADNPRKGTDYTHILSGLRRLMPGDMRHFTGLKTITSAFCSCCISLWTVPRVSKTSEPHEVYCPSHRAEIPSFHNGEFGPIKFTSVRAAPLRRPGLCT